MCNVLGLKDKQSDATKRAALRLGNSTPKTITEAFAAYALREALWAGFFKDYFERHHALDAFVELRRRGAGV